MKTVVFAAIAALVAFAPVHAAESKSASSSSSSASHLAADAVACDPAALAAACPGKDKACMGLIFTKQWQLHITCTKHVINAFIVCKGDRFLTYPFLYAKKTLGFGLGLLL